jgi:carbon storage regulator
MLVLTRKLMERLYIGDDICVTVVRLEGGQVRLGIEAPRHIRVVRAELMPLDDSSPRPTRPPNRTDPPAVPIRSPRTEPRGSESPRRAPSG